MVSKDSFIYRSGDLFAPKNVRAFLETFIYGSYNDTVYITYWSVLHLLSGIGLAIVFRTWTMPKNPYIIGFIVHTVWELWQILIKMSNPFKVVGHNNIVDTLLDTALFMFGMWIVLSRK
jgi:hypothetical protein